MDSAIKEKVKKAMDSIPDKPLTGYFQHRIEKMKEFGKKNIEKPGAEFNLYYNQLSDDEKNKINKGPTKQQKEYEKLYDRWLFDHNITTDEVKEYQKYKRAQDKAREERSRSRTGSASKSKPKSKSKSKAKAKKSRSKDKEASKKKEGKATKSKGKKGSPSKDKKKNK